MWRINHDIGYIDIANITKWVTVGIITSINSFILIEHEISLVISEDRNNQITNQ